MSVRLVDAAYSSSPNDTELLILLEVIVASNFAWSVLHLR